MATYESMMTRFSEHPSPITHQSRWTTLWIVSYSCPGYSIRLQATQIINSNITASIALDKLKAESQADDLDRLFSSVDWLNYEKLNSFLSDTIESLPVAKWSITRNLSLLE
ncbi:uncharacterized protein BDV17DRAFT_285968 [Aspergillus undulatus]|uniref:uncharacterized protein n=1 Tax=Aspergillus undulatus TaxID=1810928 RepID=UPI003CCD6FEB